MLVMENKLSSSSGYTSKSYYVSSLLTIYTHSELIHDFADAEFYEFKEYCDKQLNVCQQPTVSHCHQWMPKRNDERNQDLSIWK